MDFVYDNLTWIIIGAVFFIMVIIGYYAEKTDFGRKTYEKRVKEPQERKKSKKEERKEQKLKEKMEKENRKKVKVQKDVRLVDAIKADEEVKNVKENNDENISAVDYFDNVDFGNNENQIFENEGNTGINFDETDTLYNANGNSFNENNNYTVDEDLTVPFGDPVNFDNNEHQIREEIPSIDEADEEINEYGKNVSELQIDTPKIDEIVSEPKEDRVVEDDDVWNF